MRRLGVIGGISWHATASYYEQLNTGVQERLGGHHSADLLLHSLNFAEVEALQRSGDWSALEKGMVASARARVSGGAEALLIGANAMGDSCARPLTLALDGVFSPSDYRAIPDLVRTPRKRPRADRWGPPPACGVDRKTDPPELR